VVTTILLVRHGETDWNRQRRFQGRADVPLNEDGRTQVVELAGRHVGERFAAAYTSPLRRAAESAAILGKRLGLVARPTDALQEVDVGSWSGLTVTEIEDRFPQGFRRWIDWKVEGWEDGEQSGDFRRRVVGGLLEIAGRHPGGQVLAVTTAGRSGRLWRPHSGVRRTSCAVRTPSSRTAPVVRIAVQDGVLQAVD